MIKLKQDAKQVELVKAIGSKNKTESLAAQEAFAAAVGPVIGQVLNQLGTAPLIYEDYPFGEDESPIFPLDFYYGAGATEISVWAASKAGGLPSSWIESSGELRFTTYDLDSAVNFDKKYARKTFAFNVLSKAVDRMLNELLVKQERQAWATILRALGEARTGGTKHTIASTTINRLQLDDFNRLLTLAKRLNQSYAGGTPANIYSSGPTDIFFSPEMKEQIRGFAYNPMNTTAVPNTDESTAVALPDSIREEIYRSAGSSSIYGINLTELNELGTSQKYNILFGQYASAGIANAGGNFSTSGDEVVIAIDTTKGAFQRAVRTDGTGTATVTADDQFLIRSEKVGFFTSLTESRLCLDGRAISAVIV